MLNLMREWWDKSSRGLYPPEHKELTAGKAVVRLPFPEVVHVPLTQHIGSPAIPLVHPGQEVVRGEPIASASGVMSVPMHAPATGRVREIRDIPSLRGVMTPAIVIDVYPSSNQAVLYGSDRDISHLTPEMLADAVQEAGIVGLGGSGFPTHVKMRVPDGRNIDTVIANGCESEPVLTSDHRIMVEESEAVRRGLAVVQKALGAKRAIIGVESNKPDAVNSLTRPSASQDPVEIRVVPSRYPAGAEKVLIKTLLGREVPAGGLTSEVGVVVFNVTCLAQIGELLPLRQGLIERVITVTGAGIEKPGNYLVPLGTPVRHVLACAGLKPGKCRVVFGGPMMGTSISSWDMPITKGTPGVLVLPVEEDAPREQLRPCIRCGRCLQVCPIHLNPCQLGKLARVRDYEQMTALHLMDCIECGCCSYVCPAGIPLARDFKTSKQIVRERKAVS